MSESNTSEPTPPTPPKATRCTGLLRSCVPSETEGGADRHRMIVEVLDGPFQGRMACRNLWWHTPKGRASALRDLDEFGYTELGQLVAEVKRREYRLRVLVVPGVDDWGEEALDVVWFQVLAVAPKPEQPIPPPQPPEPPGDANIPF